MAFIYKAINPDVSNGGGGVATPYVQAFNTASWGAPSGGIYSIVILAATHGKTTTPMVQVFEFNGSNYEDVSVDIEVDGSGNVTINVIEIPDTRFEGRIVIL